MKASRLAVTLQGCQAAPRKAIFRAPCRHLLEIGSSQSRKFLGYIQDQIKRGELSPRAAYELSKLDNDEARRSVAQKAVHDGLTRDQTADVVREQKGKANRPNRGTHLTFVTDTGWKVAASAKRKGTYAEVEEALLTALEEVRHRLRNNVQIL